MVIDVTPRPGKTPAEILAPIAKRRVSKLLEGTDDGSQEREDIFGAFWELVYAGIKEVTWNMAMEAALELERSSKTVQDVIDGWKPKALREAVA